MLNEIIITVIVSYTAMFANSGVGDICYFNFNPADAARSREMTLFLSVGFTKSTENHWEYVYDRYDNTVAKLNVYSYSKIYPDLPQIGLTYSTGKLFTYFETFKLLDKNYTFEQIIRDANYTIADTILEETEGCLRFYTLGAGFFRDKFYIRAGLSYACGHEDSLSYSGIVPGFGCGIYSKILDAHLSFSTSSTLKDDIEKKIPGIVSLDLTLKSPTKLLDRASFKLTYTTWEQVDTSFHNTLGGEFSLFHTFQDVTTFGTGAGIVKSYVDGKTYIPSYKVYLSHKIKSLEIGTVIIYSPFAYKTSQKIEESTLNINTFFKINI